MGTPEFDSLDQLKRAFDALPLAVLICDARFCWVFSNAAAARLLTFSQDELLTMKVDDLIPEQLRGRYRELREEATQHTGGVLDGERVLRGKDGREFSVQISATPIRIAGSPHYLICSFDTTEQKRKEQETLDRLQSIVEHSEACIFLLEAAPAGGFAFESFNANVEKLMGLRSDQARGRRAEQIFAPRQAARMNDNYERCVAQRAAITYEEHVGPSENCRLFRTTLVPVLDAEGRVYRIIGLAHDITEQREAEGALAETRQQAEQARGLLEQQLREAQKMEALGTFAGGIAHDFNNILAAMLTNAELIRLDVDEPALVLEYLGELLHASERAKDLVRRILTFSRRQPQQRRRLRADVPLLESVRLLRSMLPATLEIVLEIAADAPFIFVDDTQFQQVMMNLGANAAHAMGASAGKLTIRLETVLADAELIRNAPELRPLRYARLSVSDTGHGIPTAAIARIFEPFFTTKVMGEGTGLGLSVVHGIVREHDGVIAVESEVGRGTTFTIYLPEETIGVGAPSLVPATAVRGNGESLLLVEDELVLGRAVSALLRALGYVVVDVASPAQALALFEGGAAFDVVLTDLTMPGMTGIELTREIHRISPAVPVVLMSGYFAGHTSESLRALGIEDLITKPLTTAELATKVARALAVRRA